MKTACEIILYICEVGNLDSLDQVVKVLYLADKLHLQNNGRFIYNEKYKASPFGPLPSSIDFSLSNRSELGSYFSVHSNKITPSKTSDRDYLSESCVECISKVLSIANLNESLYQDAAWSSTKIGEIIDIIAIAKTITNNEKLLEHLLDPYPELCEAVKIMGRQ